MAVVINGSGTVTGLSVGGLPDGTVDEGTLASDSVTAAKIPDTVEAGFKSGRKNMIINGAMQVAQRGTSNAAFGAGYLVADRFRFGNNGSYGNQSQYTVTQDSNAPDGFAYSMKLSVGADIAAPSSTQASFIEQIFEKTNVDCLAYGTSSAKSVTLSFWVKSSLTGQFGVALEINSTISNSRNYTISSANTWEKKTLTFTGNTSTAISGDTFKLRFGLSFGSTLAQSGGDSWVSGTYYGASGNVNLGDTQNATWQITGVQLELGSVATDFEHRSYGEELALCQRYYEIVADASQSSDNTIHYVCGGFSTKSDQVNWNYFFQVVKRGTFTLEATTGTDYYKARNHTDFIVDTAVGMTADYQGLNCVNGYISGSYSGSTEGKAWQFTLNNANAKIAVSAEL